MCARIFGTAALAALVIVLLGQDAPVGAQGKKPKAKAAKVKDKPKDSAKDKDGDAADAPDPEGPPVGAARVAPPRYAVWHDAKGWHLRAVAAGGGNHFRGQVSVYGGQITTVTPFGLDRSQVRPDIVLLNANRDKFVLDFKNLGGTEGVDFTVSGKATTLRFTLMIDGQHVPQKIVIGRRAARPAKATFDLPAHPDK
jgi:hypothetical protein